MKHIACLLLLLLLNCFAAARADDNKLTVEQLQKILDCQKDSIKHVSITNGQPLFDVKVADKNTDQTVDVKEEERKKLIQQVIASAVPLTIHDNLIDWVKYKFSGNRDTSGDLTCSGLATILLENKASTITHVDVIDGTNSLDVQIDGQPAREVVMPVEIKQEVVDQMAVKGVKVDHKPAKLDFSFILPGFILGVIGLGAVYMFSPMKLASEVNPKPTVISPPAAGEPGTNNGANETEQS
ncbi:hypothetical protein BH10CYA1_BH10CYA1_12400 [soil metagenome]